MVALYVNYPSWISPYVIKGLPVRWYAVMYLVAFFITYLLVKRECLHDHDLNMDIEEIQSLFMTCILLLLVGARLFSCLFYSDAGYYLAHPWMVIWPFRGTKFVGLPGMSYHGGVLGTLAGGLLFCKRHKRNFLEAADVACAAIPLGYTFGRIGNFINAELYGRVTASPLGMVFPGAERFPAQLEWVREIADKAGLGYQLGDLVNLPRHPSQLYEAFFEGLALFAILWCVMRPLKKSRALPHGTIMASYFIGYGLLRFFIEYCRQPDADIGYVIGFGEGAGNIAVFTSFLNISKGQVFCLIMMLSGVLLECIAYWRRKHERF